jgi:4-hydroxy-tetrahydrodipicolinate reductase
LATANKVGIIIAANFALGAVLMMHFAKLAARYMDYAEIIELHHNQKADAPSGTAINTAKNMASFRGRPFSQAVDDGKDFPSRGEKVGGVTIHSVRLPGLMAHQEVLFGGLGQTLSIRHDTISRECYVPGVLLAVHEVVKHQELIQGLDSLLIL